ncbi:tetratricopeptide repeat protein [Cupriavidus sp. RAF12]|uniref:tetratricopeptide repeat protein n=1 Tax=Cupriavidus sp. RAF12 TaxID=3233050 RepID=UPI003F8F8FFE
MQKALRAKQFDTIEKVLRMKEVGFEQGKLNEYDLVDAFKPFYQQEDVFSNEMTEWTKQRPNSYVAHLARGTYYRKLGEFRRGTRYMRETPAANVRFMQEQFEIAKKDLHKALDLNPRSYLAILNLLNITLRQGDYEQAEELLRRGNKLYPRNILMRGRYMVHLQPRWGGSYEAMDAFVRKSRADGVPDTDLNLLVAIKLEDIGFTSEEHGDFDSARKNYLKALALSSDTDRRFVPVHILHAADWCSRNC